jgi:DNA-binding CsgD family transcriptional regulator
VSTLKVNAVLVSRYGLVRELLQELLRTRCGVQVVGQYGGRDALPAALPPAQIWVCDTAEQTPVTRAALLERAATMTSPPQVIEIDETREAFDVEAFVRRVREIASAQAQDQERLTPLEIEVMIAIATGMRNADVALRMGRSFKTVEKHRANLLRKLGLRSVAQLTAYAIQNGLLSVDAILTPKTR